MNKANIVLQDKASPSNVGTSKFMSFQNNVLVYMNNILYLPDLRITIKYRDTEP